MGAATSACASSIDPDPKSRVSEVFGRDHGRRRFESYERDTKAEFAGLEEVWKVLSYARNAAA